MEWVIGVLVAIGIVGAIAIYAVYESRNRKLLKQVTTLNRGTPTELKALLKLLKSGFPPNTLFHDLYVEKSNGNHSQIDLVMLTDVGIIVFEVKSYSGWIFGNGNNKEWTQVLAYGRDKYKFYNPVIQNNWHIEALKKRLGEYKVPYFSVVVFYGNCELRDVSNIPNNVAVTYSGNVLQYVNSIINNNPIMDLDYANKVKVVEILKQSVENGNCAHVKGNHSRYVAEQKNRFDT